MWFVIEDWSIFATNADWTTQTKTDTGVDVTTWTWIWSRVWRRLMIELINWVSAKFYVDWALVATHTTNLPDSDWWLFQLNIDNASAWNATVYFNEPKLEYEY